MNHEFEALPFGIAGETESASENEWEGGWEGEREGEWEAESGWEGERGMRPMARGTGRAGGMGAGGGRVLRPGGRSGGRGGPGRSAMGGRAQPRPSPMGRTGKPGGMGRPGRPGAPMRPRPWPGYRPGPRWAYPGPYYGGLWPYTTVVTEPPPQAPDHWSDAAPPEEPPFDDGADAPPEDAEVPPTIAATIGRLPAAQRPAYIALGAITSALRDPRATGAGFYLIEFTVNGVQRAYSGQTGNLRRRLQQHALCGQMMGLPLSAHAVYVAPSSLPDAQRRAVEYRIHDDMFRNSAGVLTNQRRELEAELFGNAWR